MGLRETIATAAKTARALFGVTIVYQADGQEITDLKATVGRTNYDADTGEGTIVRAHIRDYLIAVTDLVLNGQKILPAKGHRIIETDGDDKLTYEVTALNGQLWRYSDPMRQTLRIHTKLKSTA